MRRWGATSFNPVRLHGPGPQLPSGWYPVVQAGYAVPTLLVVVMGSHPDVRGPRWL